LILHIQIKGLQTKGSYGCPTCGPCTSSRRSSHLGKTVYDEYIMFLKPNHPYRVQDIDEFGGNECLIRAPLKMNPKRWMNAYRNANGNSHAHLLNDIQSYCKK